MITCKKLPAELETFELGECYNETLGTMDVMYLGEILKELNEPIEAIEYEGDKFSLKFFSVYTRNKVGVLVESPMGDWYLQTINRHPGRHNEL